MAQMGWVFLDNRGGRHKVGLYHGDRTGHLVIHCNMRVVQIDFSVLESRNYSFFIEDELCEVHLEKQSNGFGYEFVVNKTVDTPRNRERKADARKNNKYLVYFVVGLVVVLGLAVFGLQQYGRSQKNRAYERSISSKLTPLLEQQLNTAGSTSNARLYVVEESLQRKVVYGFSTADGAQVAGKFVVPDTGAIMLPNNFPLTDQDEFEATYLPDDPQVHRINFTRPTAPTVANYLKLAAQAEQSNHPGETDQHCFCVTRVALERQGWPVLAHFIHQNDLPATSREYNRDSYLRLVRDVEFAKAVKGACWDK